MINHKLHIDESYVKKLYQEIFEHIQEIKQNPKSYINHQNWAKKICEPKNKLIKNLTYLLEQNDINFKEKERILSILSYILLLNNNISNQLTKNSTLDKIIIEFICQYQKEFHKINIYGINVLSFVYHINNISSLINGIFIDILFNSLKIIEDEINSLYKKIENNPFIDEYHINENSYLIIEIILQFLNKEKDSKKIIKILVCLKNIFDKEQKDVLRSKDMESFIDISIRHLESDDDNALIISFLNIFIRLTKYNTYYTIMYKTKELQDICDEYIKSNKVSQTVQFKCGKVLKNIVKHLKLKLFMKTNYHGLTLDQFDDDIDGVEEEEESEEDEGDDEQ